MIKVEFGHEFNKMYMELIMNDKELMRTIRKRLEIFRKNPKDTRLDNHSLTKRMAGKWSFSITDDIRIVYEWLGKSTVRFLAIGGHGKVYKN